MIEAVVVHYPENNMDLLELQNILQVVCGTQSEAEHIRSPRLILFYHNITTVTDIAFKTRES